MDIRRQTGTIRVKIAIKQLLKSCNRSLGEVSQQIRTLFLLLPMAHY
jgi:hypothetical protein